MAVLEDSHMSSKIRSDLVRSCCEAMCEGVTLTSMVSITEPSFPAIISNALFMIPRVFLRAEQTLSWPLDHNTITGQIHLDWVGKEASLLDDMELLP